MPITPRKRFGQHFLHDLAIIDAIIRAIDPQPEDNIVEIGPGLSALTRPLLWRVPALTAIEIDRDLVKKLSQDPALANATIIQADALKVDYGTFGQRLRLVGNLPYNISSPLLFHLLLYADHVLDMHFMLQKEMVERMVAKPGTRAYGRLSVMLQASFRMIHLFDVAPEAFEPPPRVTSAVVRIRPIPKNRRLQPKNKQVFAQVVAQAFSQRRKMLRRALAKWQPLINWQAIGASDDLRAEQLTVAQFVALSDQLTPHLAQPV